MNVTVPFSVDRLLELVSSLSGELAKMHPHVLDVKKLPMNEPIDVVRRLLRILRLGTLFFILLTSTLRSCRFAGAVLPALLSDLQSTST